MKTLNDGVKLRLFSVRCPGCPKCPNAPISIIICRTCPRFVDQTIDGVHCKD